MSFRIRRAALAAALTLAVTPAAFADTFTFGNLLAGNGPGTASFATLSVTQVGGDLQFTLSAPGLDQFGSNTFLGAIAVDGQGVGSIIDRIGDSPVALANGGGPTGIFDFRFDLTGPQQARLTDDESVSWTWANAAQSISNLHFAAHLQSVDLPGYDDSLWYSPGPVVRQPVPEPETAALMLAGLGVVGLLSRRRARR